jgi:hypothetical protein
MKDLFGCGDIQKKNIIKIVSLAYILVGSRKLRYRAQCDIGSLVGVL